MNQMVAKGFLNKLGVHDIDFAGNGEEAIKLTKQNNYDFILMDIQMPIMDGLIATKEIRNLDLKKRPVIIGASANAFPEDIEKGLDVGMDYYIAKPIQFEKLHNILDSVKLKKSA